MYADHLIDMFQVNAIADFSCFPLNSRVTLGIHGTFQRKYVNIKAGTALSTFLSNELHCLPARLYHKSRWGPSRPTSTTVNTTAPKEPNYIWNRVS